MGLSPRGRGNPGRISKTNGLTARVYPRVGGGTPADDRSGSMVLIAGLSPRGRGNHVLKPPVLSSSMRRVYPRVGGGTHCYVGAHKLGRFPGSIPAWAGEPSKV